MEGIPIRSWWNEFNEVETRVMKLTEIVDKTLNCSLSALRKYIKEGETGEEIKENYEKTHHLETKADKIRRKIINSLISGHLMPNTRTDFISLVENIDDIANESEHILERVILPEFDLQKIKLTEFDELSENLKQQSELLIEAVECIFTNIEKAYSYTHQIEMLETEVDKIEERMIKELRDSSKYEVTEKIIYRDFINKAGNLANIIEDAGDEIELIIAIRKG